MIGVVREPRVAHPAHPRVVLQVARHRERVLAVPVHAHRQRLDPLQDEEGVEGRDRRAHVPQRHHPRAADEGRGPEGLRVDHAVVGGVRLAHAREALPVLGPGEAAAVDDGAPERGAVSAHVLGEGVHHHVRAVLEGPAEVGRGHRVVHDERDAARVRHLGERPEVDHVARGVADRLAEDGLRAPVDEPPDARDVPVVREARLDPEAREGVREEVVGAAVELRGRDDVVARLGEGEEGIGDRGHPRGHRERPHSPLHLRHALLEHRGGGIHDARVDVARDLEIEEVGPVLGVVEGVGGGLVDGHGHGPGGGLGRVAAVDRDRLYLHCALLPSAPAPVIEPAAY